MTNGDETGIPILNFYIGELEKSLRQKSLLSLERLVHIVEYIRYCDELVSTRFEVVKLLEAKEYFNRYCQYWMRGMGLLVIPEELIIGLKTKIGPASSKEPRKINILVAAPSVPDSPSPKKNWEISENDRKFLKSLRIASDISKDEDDGA